MDDLKLIYVYNVGEARNGDYIYEFIFSDSTNNISGDDWDLYPAAGKPSPPYKNFIKATGRITSETKLDLIQNNDSFAVYDALDGVIGLAWENIDEYIEYPESRMVFLFGNTYEKVKDILYSKDIILKIKNVKDDTEE